MLPEQETPADLPAGRRPVEVFVSYAREDRARATVVMSALREEGFVVWWDDEIQVGTDFRTTLAAMLDETRSVLVLWSRASVPSRWVREEADHAQECKKLIPACIDDVQPPIGFRSAQCAMLTRFDGDRQHPEFRKLCNAIRQVVGPAGAAHLHPPNRVASPASAGGDTLVVGRPIHERSVPWARRLTGRKAWLFAAAVVVFAATAAALVPEGGDMKTGRDGLLYRRVQRGQFSMGCADCEPDEQPVRRVRLTSDFWITATEVTVDAYRRFVAATGRVLPPQTRRPEADPARFNRDWLEGTHPIVNVNYDEATQYCGWAGGSFPWNRGDLPTEAQWEYAARGGTTGLSFPWGDEISREKANYGYKDPKTGEIHPRASERGARDRWLFTSPVASFEANGFGLYDMVGNVQEWCRDAYRPYDPQRVTDPLAVPLTASEERVVRGGSFLYDYDDSRVENRSKNPPDGRYPDTGFRCVLAVRQLW